jgi:hypothetical protein
MVLINGQSIDMAVIAQDGSEGGQPTDHELSVVAAIDSRLQADEQFQAAYPNTKLERVESMRGIPDDQEGRFYFRYQEGIEFWGHIGKNQHLNFKKGIICVSL